MSLAWNMCMLNMAHCFCCRRPTSLMIQKAGNVYAYEPNEPEPHSGTTAELSPDKTASQVVAG